MTGINQINSYADAKLLYDSVKPWRGSTDRPWGKRTHSTKRMRMDDDGSIIIEYYGHSFIKWHPDQTVTIEPFTGPQQSSVWSHMLPDGVQLDDTKRVGTNILVCPDAQVRRGSHYWLRFPRWISKSGDVAAHPRWGDRKLNPDVMAFGAKFDGPITLGYCAERTMWWPVNEDDLKTFEWAEIDKPKARKISEAYKLRDFEAYLRAIDTLHADALAPFEDYIDDEDLLDLIKAGDFTAAMKHFPRGDGWQHRYRNYAYYSQQPAPQGTPTWSWFARLRTELYKREGALVERSATVLTLPEYERVQGLLYRFE